MFIYSPMVLPKYICSQINFPICKSLKIEPTVYDAFETSFIGIKICSPYALVLLIITVVCAVRMIAHVDSIFSSIGRGEMKTIFLLYLISNIFLIFTLCLEKSFTATSLKYLNGIQVSFMSTTFFALCASGYTTEKIYGIFGMNSETFMRILCGIYFTIISIFSQIFISTTNKELILILMGLEIVFLISYLGSQSRNLKRNKGEIWGFGVLGVIFLFFILSKVHSLVAGGLVADLSERNLDNMFMNICYTFLVIMMCHKFWLSTYDFEIECLALYQ